MPTVWATSRTLIISPSTKVWSDAVVTTLDEMLAPVIFLDTRSRSSVEELFVNATVFEPEITCVVVEFQASAEISLNSLLNSFILVIFSAAVNVLYMVESANCWTVTSANTSPIVNTSLVLPLILFCGASSNLAMAIVIQSSVVKSARFALPTVLRANVWAAANVEYTNLIWGGIFVNTLLITLNLPLSAVNLLWSPM